MQFFGHGMAEALAQGHIGEVLEGYEPVYGGTPAMRYFRAAERIIFGDTNLGLTALISCLPLWVFLLVQRLCGARWAYISAFFFLFSPVSFSFGQYVVCGLWDTRNRWGAGFFSGAVLLMKMQPGPGRKGWLCRRRGRVVRVPGRGMFGGVFFSEAQLCSCRCSAMYLLHIPAFA